MGRNGTMREHVSRLKVSRHKAGVSHRMARHAMHKGRHKALTGSTRQASIRSKSTAVDEPGRQAKQKIHSKA